MNFFGEGEPMHNHESGWEEEALENCGGAVHVRRNIIPKSLTPDFTPQNVTILTLLYFRLKLGINSLHHFQTKRGIYRGSQWGGGFYGYWLRFWPFYGYRLILISYG